MTMRVELVEPEGEIWSGSAEMVIARTLDGEIGLLTNHAPLIGILYEGSMVQIRPDAGDAADIFAAVTGGFLSMADNRVSILARRAQLGAGGRHRGCAGSPGRGYSGSGSSCQRTRGTSEYPVLPVFAARSGRRSQLALAAGLPEQVAVGLVDPSGQDEQQV